MRAPRWIRALCATLLAGGGMVVVASPAGAAEATVSTEAQLRTALADPTTTTVTLASSIDLVDCTPTGGDLDRNGALVLDGAGFTLRQTCAGERVVESTAGALTLQHVTITGGDQTGTGFVLGGGVLAAGDLALDDTTVTDNTLSVDSPIGDTVAGGGFGGGVEADGAITVTDSHVDGNSIAASGGAYGAGILSGAGQNVTITDSTVDGNTSRTTDPTRENAAANGGGVALVATHDRIGEIITLGGSARLVRASVSGNVAHTQAAGLTFAVGAGIFADAVMLESSHVDANELRPSSTGSQAAGWGGGVLSTTLTATDSTLDRNVVAPDGTEDSAEGGGAWSATGGNIVLTDSSASRNTVTVTTTSGVSECAGLLAEALTLTRATVSDNRASGADGAIGGGACGGTVAIDSSTLHGNAAIGTADDAWGGGGVFGIGTIRNSTVSGNSVSGSTAHGGALTHAPWFTGNEPGELALVNSTVTGNDATGAASSGGGIDLPGQIGGLPPDAGTVSLIFSTVAGNEAASGANIAASAADGTVTAFGSTISAPLGGGTNCDGFSIADTGYTAVTDTSCGTAASADPQLGVLGDNGGPTRTMLPAATSPLLDQVPSDACLALVTVDQRGVTRPQGTACDIGAVEREVPPPPPPRPPPPPEPTPVPTATDGPTAAPAVAADPRFTG